MNPVLNELARLPASWCSMRMVIHGIRHVLSASTAAAVFPALFLFGSGCPRVVDTQNAQEQPQEMQTPLGCNKAARRYYDPASNQCVEVQSVAQALALDRYRYIAELREAGDRPADFDVYFSTPLPWSATSPLLRELESAPDFHLVMFDAYLPRVGGGTTINAPLEDAQVGDAPAKMIAYWSTLQPLNQETMQALSGGDFVIWTVRVHARPSSVAAWWNAHVTLLSFVNPLVANLDKLIAPPVPESIR